MSDNIKVYNPDKFYATGTLKVYNKPKKGKKYEVKKSKEKILKVLTVIGLTTVLAASSYVLKPNKTVVIPSGKVSYTVDYTVTSNDNNWAAIARNFYDDEEKKAYGSFGNYKNEIKDGKLHNGSTVQVPNIIDEDNPLYVSLKEIEAEFNNVKNNMWQTYNVEPGEDLYGIAKKLVADVNQIEECMSMIQSKNKISNSSLIPTGEIGVPNSKYFELKLEYDNIKQELDNSLNHSIKH